MWHTQERGEVETGFQREKPDGKRSLRNLGAGGKIILTWILKRCWRVSTGSVLWYCEHDSDLRVNIKCGNIVTY